MANPKYAAIFLVFLLTSSILLTEGKTVVFLPLLVTSHIRLTVYIAEELIKMNHSVWIGLSSDAANKIQASPNINFIWYDDFWESSVDKLSDDVEGTVSRAIETDTEPDWQWLFNYEETISQRYISALRNGTIFEHIRKIHPDLIVIDWWPSVNEHVAIPYKLKVPFAVLSGQQFPVTAKMPFQPVAEAFNSPYISEKANLFEKASAVFQNMRLLFGHICNDRGIMKELFPDQPDVPTSSELMSQAEIYIVESDAIYDYPRPALPNLKFIGGVSAHPAKELQDPFKSFVERSHKAGIGVAVFSFGSLFMNLPKKLELKLVSVLKRIKLNTIWRANITSPDPDKILTSTWIPQNDLLGNKHVQIYLTHSGLHSFYEGIYHGKPTVYLPIFFDQFPNAQRAEQKGYGRFVDMFKASEDEMVAVIEEVAASEKIKATIGKASAIYRELYKNPKQEAAFWLDHVMRYGGSYMRSSGQNIPMYLFVLDYVIAFLAGFFVAIGSVLICCVLKCVYCSVFRKESHMKKD